MFLYSDTIGVLVAITIIRKGGEIMTLGDIRKLTQELPDDTKIVVCMQAGAGTEFFTNLFTSVFKSRSKERIVDINIPEKEVV